jgi:two-component system, OmpR family, response regulator VanR
MKITIKPKILVVEAQAEILAEMTLLLEHAGFCVFGARNGVDGIRLSEKGEFDLVILDVNLPGQDGFEVCARLKQDFRFSRTPIIFISGQWNEEDRRRALELGAADYIDKPFDAPAFGRRICSHIKATRSWPDKNGPDP